MDEIMAIAEKYNLWVIEDCAQAHLATYKGRLVGTFGNAATFSFYPGKNLGAYGDAGCIVTNDDALADWTATFARHGGKGEHVMEGINSRMDGLQAAILNVKLPHLPSWTTARRRVAARYNDLLSGIDNLTTPKVGDDRSHVYHLYIVGTDKRDSLKKALADYGYNNLSELSEGFAVLSGLRLSRPQPSGFSRRLPQSISNSFSSDLSGND